jgi:hypothetical protein
MSEGTRLAQKNFGRAILIALGVISSLILGYASIVFWFAYFAGPFTPMFPDSGQTIASNSGDAAIAMILTILAILDLVITVIYWGRRYRLGEPR